MENASKALIMAASILVGVMIISVGVALFNSFSEFSRSTVQKVEDAKIAEWNNNYLKYYGNYTDDNGKERPIQVTAHDIVSIANSAKQNNINYELDTQNYNENTYYLQVQVKTDSHFESKTDEEKNKFLKENSLTKNNDNTYSTKYYMCTEVKVSEATKRVVYIKFDDYKEK